MAEAICPVCDNPLPTTPHGGSPRRYCSKKCRYLAKNRARRARTDGPRCTAHPDCSSPAFARGWCNAHYWQWHTHGDPLAGERPKPPKPRKVKPPASAIRYRTCRHCDTLFVQARTVRQALFCSDQCRLERNRQQQRESSARRRVPVPRVTVNCAECGARFTATKRQRYCCPDHARRAARRQRDATNGKWRRSVAQYKRILDRDGYRCQLCHRRIDPALTWPHPDFGTLDHIVPRSAGGTDDDVNMRAAHHRCNSQKSTGIYGHGDQLLLIG